MYVCTRIYVLRLISLKRMVLSSKKEKRRKSTEGMKYKLILMGEGFIRRREGTYQFIVVVGG